MERKYYHSKEGKILVKILKKETKTTFIEVLSTGETGWVLNSKITDK